MTQVSNLQTVVVRGGTDQASRTLEAYAEFWKIPYQTNTPDGKESTVFTSDTATALKSSYDNKVILTPVGREGAEKVASEVRVSVKVESRLLSLPVRKDTTVSLNSDFYWFSGSRIEPVLTSDGVPILSRVQGTSLHLLGLDLASQYAKLLYEAVEESPSWRFRLVTKLPFSYRIIPSFLRNRAFRSQRGLSQIKEENLGPVEFLRTVFLASLVRCAGPIPRIRFWRRGKTYALSVTHDVETEDGLNNGTAKLIEVEEPLQIRSTWNIPSNRYPLSSESLERLQRSGEIGAHDTRHDGRLAFLSTKDKTRRLASCMARLEELTGQRVRGFRAPLLQHSKSLVEAVSRAGYEYDSSCPAWEILSPTSLHPHGVGTIFPFFLSHILEIPVSLPQDHQLLRVAGQTPTVAVDLLLRLSKWIRGVGGACVLLAHPEYEFATAENKHEYNRLLESFRSDPECEILTLREMSEWWKLRSQARIGVDGDHVSIVSPAHLSDAADLHAELVTGYGENGFNVVNIS